MVILEVLKCFTPKEMKYTCEYGFIFAILIIGGVVNTKESLTLFGVYQEMQFAKTTNYCSFYENKINSKE